LVIRTLDPDPDWIRILKPKPCPVGQFTGEKRERAVLQEKMVGEVIGRPLMSKVPRVAVRGLLRDGNLEGSPWTWRLR
jgi:hypothetical protein